MNISEQYVLYRCEKKLKELDLFDNQEYIDRFNMEFDVITSMGFTDYFLIVADYINWARQNWIGVGPGRGSGASSIVGWLLGITEPDPVRWKLPFERFLNPYRVSPPDFDVDFSTRRREEVIQYVINKYGEDYACQIGTFGTMKARLAVRKAAKAMGVEPEVYNKYSKLIPEEEQGGVGAKKVTLQKCLDNDSDIVDNYSHQLKRFRKVYDSDLQFQDIVNRAVEIEGSVASFGVHAAGVVVGDEKLAKYLPIGLAKEFKNSDRKVITQWDKDQVEDLGFIKFDFLGLKTLDIIQDTIDSVRDRLGIKIDWSNISEYDSGVFDMLSNGNTDEVFQLDSSGMQGLCKSYKPINIGDISNVLALYRPGPLACGVTDQILKVRNGECEPYYYDERLKSVLEPTLGTLVYQEQTMALAREMAGYDMGEADLLRRAIGKKVAEKMAEHEKKFIEGSVENGYSRELAQKVYDDIKGFAAYGFNRSHSLSYAYISYRTAYLKCYYPADYYAAVLTNHYGVVDKVVPTIARVRQRGIKVLSPDVNESGEDFRAVSNDSIRVGLSAIRGCGDAALKDIITTRVDKPFSSFVDFADRVSSSTKKNNIGALAAAGAFDNLEPDMNRLEIVRYAPDVIAKLRKDKSKKDKRQLGFFDILYEKDKGIEIRRPGITYDLRTVLEEEKEFLGFYVSGDPVEEYQILSKFINISPIVDIKLVGMYKTILGKISNIHIMGNNRGNFAFVTVEDQTGFIICKFWHKAYQDYFHLLSEGNILLFSGRTNEYKGIEINVDWAGQPDVEIKSAVRGIIVNRIDSYLLRQLVRLKAGRCAIDFRVGPFQYRLGFFDVDCSFLNRSKEYLFNVFN